MGRYPGIPSILDAILRDATGYFILMFLCQLLYEIFTFFTQASGTRHVRRCTHQMRD